MLLSLCTVYVICDNYLINWNLNTAFLRCRHTIPSIAVTLNCCPCFINSF